VDRNLENAVLIGQAQVTGPRKQKDAHFGADANQKAVGGDAQAVNGTGVDLEHEAALDAHHRDGQSLHFQFQADYQSAVAVYTGPSLDAGTTESAQFH